MHETGQNMFAGVLLHIVKALFPVHRAGHLFAYGKRGRQEMRQGIVFANGHMQYGREPSVPLSEPWPPSSGKKAVRSKITAKQSFTGTQDSTVASNWVIWGFVSYIFRSFYVKAPFSYK